MLNTAEEHKEECNCGILYILDTLFRFKNKQTEFSFTISGASSPNNELELLMIAKLLRI